MSDPIAALAASTAPTADAGTLGKNQQINQQQFLTLFIEQLKAQDPLSPMQPDQLTAQLAQFSSLEQLTGINTRLDTLADATKQTSSSALLSLLGKEVQVDGGQLAIRDGHVPRISYTLDDAASAVSVSILDKDGKAVRVMRLGAQDAGAHDVDFDGKGDDGQVLADGSYKVAIGALAPGAQAPTDVPVTTFATVDGVDLEGDPPALLVGDARIPLDKVHEVRAPQPAA
jgi:flagellar basal-body rod modification protein FlgD